MYYALVEEVDHYVGLLMDKLEEGGVLNRTMIIFTSDHGEMLGSHGMNGKSKFYEEASRVPLIVSNPSQFPPSTVGTVIKVPVSHLDVHATILDYANAREYDVGDGTSLRRFIEKTSYNQLFDEAVVVMEGNFNRVPINSTTLSGSMGNRPALMVRKGSFKLMLPRRSRSIIPDMMFDLSKDPGEVMNILQDPAARRRYPKSVIIGKAEHLKVLLLEFLQRHDGEGNYYASPRYHLAGRGDMTEIRLRRTWDTVDYWQSDQRLVFGMPSLVGAEYLRNEYLYVGTTKSNLRISGIKVKGPHAAYFRVTSAVRYHLSRNQYLRIQVSFRSSASLRWTTLRAALVIKNSATGTVQVPLVFKA